MPARNGETALREQSPSELVRQLSESQARHKVEDVKASVSANPLPLAVAGAFAVAFVAWRLMRR